MIDLYSYQAFKTAFPAKWVRYVFWFIAFAAYITLLLAILTDARNWPAGIRVYLSAGFLILYFAKFILLPFLLIDDVFRLGNWLVNLFQNNTTDELVTETGKGISRSQFLSRMGLFVAGIPFLAMINGMVRNAYNYQVKRIKLKVPGLPEAFKGWKIVQFSDLHTGSYPTKEPLKKVISLINQEQAELVFFTGDLVNNLAKEAQDFVELFQQIQAKEGVFSCTGNHDYGDYSRWENKEDKRANFELFKDTHKRMGWDLLLNENHIIEKDGHRLAVIGVENWSARTRYQRYGDLDKAYQKDCEDCDVQLLLSHDPSHWRAEVLERFPKINAVFSGHTHGFQFGVNLPFYKWSPVKYAYKEWIGLYQEGHQYLYVNPGLGYVGYPGRVGFLPEITVFELV